jgi:hypothetical protein
MRLGLKPVKTQPVLTPSARLACDWRWRIAETPQNRSKFLREFLTARELRDDSKNATQTGELFSCLLFIWWLHHPLHIVLLSPLEACRVRSSE